ncbi:MAG: DegT/DnrJ/EryC1/StrS family aminotransferase, partial [Candidatus Omnitrophica bacterium]|nr:DegT/DnrJ/EryC1/StrS family aminotransferase [Candidatus Omnitrophota bacterium]
IQAVVLLAKLKYLDQWNQMRSERAAYYNEIFKDLDAVKIPHVGKDRTHVFQTYAIRVKNRDRICQELQKQAVGVLIHYPIPLHLQPAYQELGYRRGDFPVAEAVTSEILSLPMFPHISKEQQDEVYRRLKKVL